MSPARNRARQNHFRYPTPRASLPTGGAERDGQSDERHGRCERRCVTHQQRPQKAAADKPNQHQQMVPDVAEPVPSRQLPDQFYQRPGEVFRPRPLPNRCIALLWIPKAIAPRPSNTAFA